MEPNVEKGKPGQRIDGGWGWVIVAGTFLACFIFSGIIRSQGIILEALMSYYGVRASEAALLTMMSNAMFTLTSLFGTVLGELYTARVVVMTASFVGSLGMCLAGLGFSVSYTACVFGGSLGVAAGFTYGNCLSMIGRYFCKKRPLANSLALTGSSFGQIALPLLIRLIIEEFSVLGACIVLGGVYLHTMIAGALYRPISTGSTQEVIEALLSTLSLAEDKGDHEGEEHHVIPNDDTYSVLSDFSHLKYTDLLKHQLQREESMISQLGPAAGSTTSKIFLPYASGENIMSASLANLQRISHRTEWTVAEIVSLESLPGRKSCCPCPPKCHIPKILDFSVLKNHKVVFFCLVYFLFQFTAMDFSLFLPAIVAERGIERYRGSLLLSINGAADLFGRLCCGLIASMGACKRYKIVVVCGLTFSCNILVFITASEYWQMAVQCAINGFFLGGHISLVSLVLIDSLGLELLPHVLGIVLFAQGVGPSMGQLLLGWVRDKTGGFEAVLIIIGIAGICAALILMCYPIVHRLEKRRVERLNQQAQTKENGV